MAGDFADYDEPGATAVAIGATDLTATGLAKESGGNLATHTALLSGTSAGALISAPGNTIAAETAALIATGLVTGAPGGTPLLHGAKQVYTVIGQVVAANGTFSTGAIPIAKPGYMIRIAAQMSAAGAVTPYMEADLTWSVTPNTGQVTAEEIWYINCGGGSSVRTNGKGPTKGNQLNITFTNGDLVDSCTINVQVWETTQHITRDDWRNSGGIAGAASTAIKGDGLANIVANDTFNVPAGTTLQKNLPLYSGQANAWFNTNAAAGSKITIVPAGDFVVNSSSPLAVFDWTQVMTAPISVILPRCPCALQILNNGGAGFAFVGSLTAVEYAS